MLYCSPNAITLYDRNMATKGWHQLELVEAAWESEYRQFDPCPEQDTKLLKAFPCVFICQANTEK